MPNNTRQTRGIRAERLQITLPPRLKNWVDQTAARREISPTQVVREILEREIDQRIQEGNHATV